MTIRRTRVTDSSSKDALQATFSRTTPAFQWQRTCSADTHRPSNGSPQLPTAWERRDVSVRKPEHMKHVHALSEDAPAGKADGGTNIDVSEKATQPGVPGGRGDGE
eukprot:CAMPEP_0174369650 /NCGR_PEP_ID=MMETSP0811_2-20130205/93216_1 /TAXON_ID=73025 ORGANISM="Eutreptiella gymnastica-like, Strain CCMP1594" /NCGR_SAMPLE_ID=MMETSP0811_2 /ASSEMBLY_ACC=CAM_ASM_000667 /LENGTH=105 /DNA_ID=CAMNT_0015514293 /DNA_START=345 /DNA_END=663 /DNA_ORIENTATION=+